MNTPETVCANLRIHNKTLADKIEGQLFFLQDEDVPGLVAWSRLQLVLVRCGNGRFLCPAQDVAHFVKIIDDSQQDYVRDLSLPAQI